MAFNWLNTYLLSDQNCSRMHGAAATNLKIEEYSLISHLHFWFFSSQHFNCDLILNHAHKYSQTHTLSCLHITIKKMSGLIKMNELLTLNVKCAQMCGCVYLSLRKSPCRENFPIQCKIISISLFVLDRFLIQQHLK